MPTLSEWIIAGLVFCAFALMIIAPCLRRSGLDVERHGLIDEEPMEQFPPEALHEHVL